MSKNYIKLEGKHTGVSDHLVATTTRNFYQKRCVTRPCITYEFPRNVGMKCKGDLPQCRQMHPKLKK